MRVTTRNALHMDVLIGAGVAVVVALLSQVTAHVLARRNAAAANDWERGERLHQERVAAYSALAGSLATYRRAMLDRATAKVKVPPGPAFEDLLRESRRSRDSALQALYLVELLCDRPEVVKAAHRAYDSMNVLAHADDTSTVESGREHTRATIGIFVKTARDTIQT